MDYYRLLNLVREPFSNSPDPVFFYRARSHAECLQRLEIALRLKRGLNVVVGEVGAGKTTICRQLLRALSEEKAADACLLLDPAAESRGDFLARLLETLGDGAELPASAEERKERVKKLLFRRAAEEGRLVVLLVDEGQKIEPGDLETLREVLNFETNEHKLLQVVIFAQLEFLDLLSGLPNVADRVNDLIRLGPFSFRETREMIRYRLEMSAEGQGGGVGRGVFTLPALWAVYRATGGFPRKIVHLCHHLVLGMIVQNRSRIGWRLVRATLERGAVQLGGRRRASRLRPALVALGLLLGTGALATALEPGVAERLNPSGWRAALPASLLAKASEWASLGGERSSGQASGQLADKAQALASVQGSGSTPDGTSGPAAGSSSGQPTPRASGQAPAGQASGQGSARISGQAAGLGTGQGLDQTSGQTPGQTAARAAGQATGKTASLESNQGFGQSSGQALGQTPGLASSQPSGQTSSQASGQTSSQASGQTSSQASGQTSSQATGQTLGQEAGQTSSSMPGTAAPAASQRPSVETSSPAESASAGGFPSSSVRYPAEPPREAIAEPVRIEALGEVTVMRGEYLNQLLYMVYGRKTPQVMAAVVERNPDIGDPSLIRVGTRLVMPAVPTESGERGGFIAQLDVKDRLEDAVQAVRALRGRQDGLSVLPYWSPSRGLRFAVCLGGWRRTEAEAQADVLRLDPVLRQGARPVGRWERGTTFFSTLGGAPEARQASRAERKAVPAEARKPEPVAASHPVAP